MEISLSLDKKYSYADYLTWADNVKREIYDGIVKLMSPAPAVMHQKIAMRVVNHLYNYLDNKPCQVFFAPFDVRLSKSGETENNVVYTVVQPDICIICDPAKLDKQGCIGAPDLIVEIVSPGSEIRDIKEKYEIYQAAGVLEYWIIRPDEKSVQVFLLADNQKYILRGTYVDGDIVPVSIFDDELEVDLTKVFKE